MAGRQLIYPGNNPNMSTSNLSPIYKLPPEQAFGRVLEKLKIHFGEATFKSWFKYLKFVSVENNVIKLATPTRFLKDWITTHYADEIYYFWQQEDSSVVSIEISIESEIQLPVNNQVQENASSEEKNKVIDFSIRVSPENLGSPVDPRFTFENFIVGKSNELAHAAALSVAESSNTSMGSNPLFIYGGVGLGKTHLMHAIAWHIKRSNPLRNVIYLSAEKFMYQFIRALRHKEIMTFKEQLRAVDVLMIDDVQFISGKDSTQEEFFHTFNALIDQNKQLVISADRSPSDLEGIEERIRSRLGWGMVADINATTYELRLGILQSKVELMKVNVPVQVLEFLAMKITSNVRELEGALNKVVAHSNLFGRDINLENTQHILQDLLRAHSNIITIDDIKKAVCERFNVRLSDMNSARRSRSVARPRQVAMYLAKRHTSHSLPEIGRRFGGKDHTTILHAIKKIEELCKQDAEFSSEVELISKIIQN